MGIETFALLVALYIAPTLVAAGRKHNNILLVFLVNLLFGWTIIGWLVALHWAGNKDVKRQAMEQSRLASGQLVVCGGCGKPISFLAKACPGCGHPRTEEEIAEAKMKAAKERGEQNGREEQEEIRYSQCPHCQTKMWADAWHCARCGKDSCPNCKQPVRFRVFGRAKCKRCGWKEVLW